MSAKSDLTQVSTPKELNDEQCAAVLTRLSRHLARFRNTALLYAVAEAAYARSAGSDRLKKDFIDSLDTWAREMSSKLWIACREPGGQPPHIDELSDTSTKGLPPLPGDEHLIPLLNAVVLLQVTSGKQYSSRTRAFLLTVAPLDESAIVATLKDPKGAIEEATKKTNAAREEQARSTKIIRMVGIGAGAVVGGVLIGVTGGLAAPAVGAGVGTVLSWLGVGGTAAGMLATGLAGSSVVCGALFGAYGSTKTAMAVKGYTREVRDLAIKPVRQPRDTMAVRLCISGWLESPQDVTAPWTVFNGDDTFALQWEVEELERLSTALMDLVKAQAMQFVKGAILKQTILASLMTALSPVVWVKLTKIIDNSWMIAQSLALKTGKVLGTLLAQRALGARPITLVGYSLGALVVFEALQHLARLPPSETLGLIHDVCLFGAPVSTDSARWAAARRVVAGRFVNGYGADDYVLAVLARVSGAGWNVAGLRPVEMQGVEDFPCEEVDGHLKWRGYVGQALARCGAPGVDMVQVQLQLERKAAEINKAVDMSDEEAARAVAAGPGDAEGKARVEKSV
ncbi:DUF726-domain-containing protein [Epithele typhae]|uniref:DUF726-domain-containing protein n=1 Tax=Epithele typhae TaxID=378194 RepID=UPI00200798C8|nr:DUF726-domain-containing protein [Epithele typhae]KAH9946142.1 DUF726-domain-containing protein [Epithele typhae]